MEIKKKLIVTRWEERGENGKRRGSGKSRNMKRVLMGTDNGMGTDCRSNGAGDRGEQGGKGGMIVTE